VALDGNALVALVGDLDLNTAPDLTRVLDTFIENGPAEVVLDFSGLSFLDSTGISVLIAAQSSLNQQGRRLTIRSPRAPARRLFEITGLTEILNVEAEGAKQRPA
jgi:anti-sigma B factor antagonist